MRKFNMAFPAARALWPYTFALFLLLALGACSSLRLAYNHGDTLLYWWLDGYVDLDREQKTQVRKDIDQLFQWHRTSQLQDYAQLLQTGQQRHLNNPTDTASLRASWGEVRQRMQVLLLHAVPELADLLRSLRPEQIRSMEKKFAANNAEFRDKYMRGDIATQQKARFQQALDQFELWFGDFSRTQEAQIRQLSDARPLLTSQLLEERMRRQSEIVALARKIQQEQPGRVATMELLRQLINDTFRQMESGPRAPALVEYEESTVQMVLGVIQLSTTSQKAHAQHRIQDCIHDLKVLAQEGHSSRP
ncbi:DUF6279 family lipoprotein [Duganella qianjiadongensis]|uniref:Lipoprotein n=1 Tax=Duganella qianjiadongensis TaxID=2692176 RepID=A0ABW9VRX5_9BURK|nr:DUF6279 family lipoprotein [Duganella qianjiadongensis]MYM41289.1 hypothetical protein [Duganella qianjiadongensis]